jgi:hypothetical protein
VRHRNGEGPAQRRHADGARRAGNGQHRPSKPPANRKQHFAVTSGRTALGVVEQNGERFTAIDINGTTIGTFDTLRAAARALPAEEGVP